MADLMPVVFLGHGNPMNAISNNVYTARWSGIGRLIPRPRAVLAVSAHWYIRGYRVTAGPAPRTMHDFGGFPGELYQVEYKAPGSPELALRVRDLLAPMRVELDRDRGLDHGTWSVLCHVFKDADIPVIQLSIDAAKPPAFHYETAKKLAPLRAEGILLMGSGNIVHNLAMYAWDSGWHPAFDWAERFEQRVRDLLAARDDNRLIGYDHLGPDAKLSVPTPDHYLPLLYVLGPSRRDEPISFPVEGIEGGSLSMLGIQIG